MSEIDWSNAPEWAVRLLRNLNSDIPHAWANEDGSRARWITDDDGCEFRLQEVAWTLIGRRPPQWSGEGLPPVGIECERNVSLSNWCPSMVYAHSPCGRYAAFWDSCGRNWANAGSFRPMRTPEEIVAEDRERAIEAMVEVVGDKCKNPSLGDAYEYTEALYDAGYRKVEGGVK